MSTRISTLPSDCVQLIFDRIPTHQLLLNVRRVSRAWQKHQQLSCRTRKSLVIVHGGWSLFDFTYLTYNKPFVIHMIDQNGNSSDYDAFLDHHKINISPNKIPKVQFLIETFPNLHRLIVPTDCIASSFIQSITQLIINYSTKLIEFKLYLDLDRLIESNLPATFNKVMCNLMNQLNSLTSLQNLTIHADYYGNTPLLTKPQIEEPKFLTRVKEFYFHFKNIDEVMVDWIGKYEKAGRMNQLNRFFLSTYPDSTGLTKNQFDHFPLSNLYSFVPYKNRLFDDNEQHLKRIVTKFPSLTTISYTLKKSIKSLTKLSTILSPLTKLVHAQLDIQAVVPSNEHFNSAHQLKSIKALDLEFNMDFCFDHHGFFPNFCQTQVPTIVHVFPNLQSIRVSNRGRNTYFDNESLVEQFFEDLKVSYGSSLRTKFCV